jgi:TolB-like protein/tRNA A-37 threonylcarbamoyl transferase component Bud32/lipoprotein NlpI
MSFDRVRHYRVLEQIGRGGMGEIYAAHDEHLDRTVVLKVIQAQRLDETSRRWFMREARAAAALSHPFICAIHEVLEHEGQPVIVMEHVRGETVLQRTAASALPAEDVCRYGREIAEALAAAHSRGIVHRDVSASNVMITADGHVKLMDFGLARVDRAPAAAADETTMARTGNLIVGTPAFTAPEVLNGSPADARSDLYGAGAVLYRMATGRLPFSAEGSGPTLSDVLTRAPAPPRSIVPSTPWALERIILRLLEKDPAARYQSAGELGSALADAALARGEGSRATRSVAVLPFKPLGRAVEDDDFGLGLADATITDLATVRSILVRPTSAILPYRDRPVDPIAAARELSVDSVVYGSFQRAAGRVRVTVQLVSAESGEPTWGTKIDTRLDDVFGLQDEVSRQIVRALDVTFTAKDEERLNRACCAPSPAQEPYMRGRVALLYDSIDHVNGAIEAFEEALRLDPAFAPAYAGLALAYANMAFTFLPDSDYYDRAVRMCDQALNLDPTLPEARFVRGRLAWTPQAGFDHAAAIRDIAGALVARPNLGEVATTLAILIVHLGMTGEARALLDRALAIDPNDLFANTHVALLAAVEGRWQDSHEAASAMWQQKPSGWTGYQVALAELHLGRVADAKRTTDRTRRQYPGNVLVYPIGALTSAIEGDAAGARRHIDLTLKHRQEFGHYHHAQYDVACALALLGERDEAVEWLEQAAANGLPCPTAFERDEWLRSLHGLPRFTALLERVRGERAAYERLFHEVMPSSGV